MGEHTCNDCEMVWWSMKNGFPCPSCNSLNTSDFEDDTMETYLNKVEDSGFECEAGPLNMSEDWEKIKELSDLWIVTKNGMNICHTSGNDGFRFTVATNQKEAEWLANLYNKERYAGTPICSVKRLLSI